MSLLPQSINIKNEGFGTILSPTGTFFHIGFRAPSRLQTLNTKRMTTKYSHVTASTDTKEKQWLFPLKHIQIWIKTWMYLYNLWCHLFLTTEILTLSLARIFFFPCKSYKSLILIPILVSIWFCYNICLWQVATK